MSDERMQSQTQEQEKGKQKERVNLQMYLPDIVTETYAKTYLAYRISLENWFLLNEMLAFIQNEKLTSKEIQNRLQKLFSVANTEIVKELVKLNQVAFARAKAEEKNDESASSEQ